MKSKFKVETIFAWLLFVVYLIVLCRLTIWRDSVSEYRNVNWTPFETILVYSRSILRGNKIIGLSNILGNVILFFPLGFLSAVLFPKTRKWARILILALTVSMAIEILQYVLACGASDIDDVLLNALGGLGGYWIYLLAARLFRYKKYAVTLSVLMIAMTCSGFFIDDMRSLFQGPVGETEGVSISASPDAFILPDPGMTPVKKQAVNLSLSSLPAGTHSKSRSGMPVAASRKTAAFRPAEGGTLKLKGKEP